MPQQDHPVYEVHGGCRGRKDGKKIRSTWCNTLWDSAGDCGIAPLMSVDLGVPALIPTRLIFHCMHTMNIMSPFSFVLSIFFNHSGSSSSSSQRNSPYKVSQTSDPSVMNRDEMTMRILNLSLKIIYLLTGEVRPS